MEEEVEENVEGKESKMQAPSNELATSSTSILSSSSPACFNPSTLIPPDTGNGPTGDPPKSNCRRTEVGVGLDGEVKGEEEDEVEEDVELQCRWNPLAPPLGFEEYIRLGEKAERGSCEGDITRCILERGEGREGEGSG